MKVHDLQPGDVMMRFERLDTLWDHPDNSWFLILSVAKLNHAPAVIEVWDLHEQERTRFYFEPIMSVTENTWLRFYRQGELLT